MQVTNHNQCSYGEFSIKRFKSFPNPNFKNREWYLKNVWIFEKVKVNRTLYNQNYISCACGINHKYFSEFFFFIQSFNVFFTFLFLKSIARTVFKHSTNKFLLFFCIHLCELYRASQIMNTNRSTLLYSVETQVQSNSYIVFS